MPINDKMGVELSVDTNKVNKSLGEFTKRLSKSTENVTKITNEIAKSTKSMSSFGRVNKKTSDAVQNLTKNMEKNSKGMRNIAVDANRASGGLSQLAGLMGTIAIGNLLGDAIDNSMSFIETVNLFNVSMGQFAEETYVILSNISDATMLDVAGLMSATANYTALARSMGIANDKAATLGRSTSQLSLDLSSLYNVPIKQVMADLRSGLLGQTETVYKYGIDLTEAALAQEALRLGISKTVRQMSQGEKMMLRYSLMIRQTTLSHQDLAKTIEEPSNQLRILKEQLISVSRAIGNLFINTVGKVLPYVNGFVGAIKVVIESLATLTGFKPPKVENTQGNLGAIGDSAEESTDKVEKLKKSMKSVLLPFDELNTISKDTGSGDGSGIGGELGEIDFGLEEYSAKLEEVKMKATEIRDRILEWLGFTKQINEETGMIEWIIPDFKTTESNFERILDTVTKIGAAILGWKIGKSLGNQVVKLAGLFGKTLPSSFATMSAAFAATTGVMLVRWKELMNESESFNVGLSRVGDLFNLFNEIIGIPIIDWFKNLGVSILKLLPEPVQQALSNMVKSFKEWVALLELDVWDMLLTIAGTLMLFNPVTLPLGALILTFEGITVAIRALGTVSDETWKKMKTSFTNGLTSIKDGFINSFEFISEKLKPITDGLGVMFKYIWETLKDIGSWLSNTFGKIWEVVFNTIQNVVIKPFSKFWEENGTQIKHVMSSIGELFSMIVGGMGNAFEALGVAIKWTWENLIKPILTAFGTVIYFLWDVVIEPTLSLISELFLSVGGSIIGVLGGVLDFIIGVFTGDWERAWSGISSIFKNIWNGIVNSFASVVNFFLRGVNKIIGWLNKIPGVEISMLDDVAFEGIKFDLSESNIDSKFQHIASQSGNNYEAFRAGSLKRPKKSNPLDKLPSGGANLNVNLDKSIQDSVNANSRSIVDSIESRPIVIENQLNLDGKVVYNNQQKIQSERGLNFGSPAFAR